MKNKIDFKIVYPEDKVVKRILSGKKVSRISIYKVIIIHQRAVNINNFSIVIPCYNEGGTLKLIDVCTSELCSNGVEAILTDNGSNDDSNKLANFINSNPLLKIFRLETNQGYVEGISYGLSKAKGNYGALVGRAC